MKRLVPNRSAFRGRAAGALLVLLAGCDALERELPMETVISWGEIVWEPVPPEHEAYVAEMVEVLERTVALERRVHATGGEYTTDTDVLLQLDVPEAMSLIVSTDTRYVEMYALHKEAPGSGCIVRLGARRLTRYSDDPREELSPGLFTGGMRLPDTPGEIECMRRKSVEELRPRITRRRL